MSSNQPIIEGETAGLALAGAAAEVGAALRARGASLVTAESCTGGMVGALLTEVAGSSEYFRGGVIAYANEVKIDVLGVSPQTLAAHGAVSAQTVSEMAIGARRLLGANLAVAVSGVAGPGGGSPEKPVGTVHIAVASAVSGKSEHVLLRQLLLPGNREQVRRAAALAAIRLVMEALRSAI